jgi:hypothetical protein
MKEVWPVTVASFLAWHGVREPVVSMFCENNKLEGMMLKYAIYGCRQTDT